MKKDFIINILILIFTNFLVRPVYLFFVEARIQNILSQDEYGSFVIMFGFCSLFLFINDPGIQNFTSKKISEVQSDKQEIFSLSFGLKIALSVLFTISCLLFALLYGYTDRMVKLAVLIAIGFSFSGMFVFLRANLSGIGAYRNDSWVSSLDRLLMVVILGSMVWFFLDPQKMNIEIMVITQLICYIISCAVVLGLLSNSGMLLSPKFDWKKYKNILIKSLPFAVIILMTSIYTRIDVVMLGALLENGESQASIYAAGYRFLDAGNMLGYLFGGLLLPMYSKSYSKGDSVLPLFDFSFRALFAICTIVAGIAIFFGQDIFALVYKQEIAQHHLILSALMLSLLPLGLAHSMGSLLQAANKLKALNIFLGVGVIFNIISNYIIIPQYGAIGAAYTTFVTELIILFGFYYLVVTKIKISLPKASIFKVLKVFTGSILIMYTCSTYLSIHFIFKIVIATLLYFLLIFLTKLIDKKEIKKYR